MAAVVSLHQQWVRIAVRVAGSWMAAMGLLMPHSTEFSGGGPWSFTRLLKLLGVTPILGLDGTDTMPWG